MQIHQYFHSRFMDLSNISFIIFNRLIFMVISITYIKQYTMNLSEHISATNYPKVPNVYEKVSDLSKISNFTLNFC